MSLVEEQQFWDMMPHRMKVTSYGDRDNHGRKILDKTTERTYRCLMEVTDSLARAIQGDSRTVGATVYCLGTPVTGVDTNGVELNATSTVGIDEEDKVEFISPVWSEPRPILSVESFYDETGDLHNMVVRFS